MAALELFPKPRQGSLEPENLSSSRRTLPGHETSFVAGRERFPTTGKASLEPGKLSRQPIVVQNLDFLVLALNRERR